MLKRILFLFLLILVSVVGKGQKNNVLLGIFTDCQYCDCDNSGERYYRMSLDKLDACILKFNSLPLEGVFHLGDMIDHGFGNYDSILPRFHKFNAPLHQVLGNHDYMIKKKYKQGLLDYIGMKEAYYTVGYGDWELIVLNGDDLSYFAPQEKKQKKERNELVSDAYSSLDLNGMIWNGGIGNVQMKWLEKKLEEAQLAHKKVIVLCHFPLYSRKDHNLLNRHQVFSLINRYSCVKAYFNGHYHAGNYTEIDGLHLVNFRGMVDTKKNAFSVVTLKQDSIIIQGFGREPDRRLKIR